MKRIISAESVNIGHPDKTCDTIADAFLDAALKQDPNAQMAVECAIKDDHLFIYGESTTTATIDYETVARKVLKDVGYECDFKIVKRISQQSLDINRAVVKKTLAAGDQGIIYGYAVRETPELMPMPIMVAHALMRQYEFFRKSKAARGKYYSDAKSQVSIEYDGKKPVACHTILVSVSHSSELTHAEIEKDILENVIKKVDCGLERENCKIIINPSGKFTIWGSFSDSGCVGRKIVVDTYGGAGRVGGGCFSSKNATKVDRSAAYYARWAAKNIVASGLADECEIQVSYAIGMSKPISIAIETFGRNNVPCEQIEKYVKDNFNFQPANIIRELDLLKPIYKNTACYGHFGREEFSWEKVKN